MTAKTVDGERYAGRRRELLRLTRRTLKTEVLLVSSGTNIRYLTGCTEGASGLLVGDGWATLFIGKMFEHVVPAEAPGVEIHVTTRPVGKEAADVLRKRKLRGRLAFEGGGVTWAQYGMLQTAMGRRKLVDMGDAVRRVRSVKDAGELRLIRKCVKIAEQAFSELVAGGVGHLTRMTEREMATELEYRMRKMGADRQGFLLNGIIVASGPNSASCHHFPTNRKPRRGEPLLFDWGAEVGGYRSDITRTLFMGPPDSRLREIYEVVEQANAVGLASVAPGVACKTVARKAWGVVRDAGWGDQVRHGLGHGLGLEVHELPSFGNGSALKAGTSERLRRNQVVTIEPGIYLAGLGGVRIEDDVLVTAKGRSVLTSLPRGLDAAIVE